MSDIDFGVTYSRCPECDALVPLDQGLVQYDPWLTIAYSAPSAQLLFACDCGAQWAIGMRGER